MPHRAMSPSLLDHLHASFLTGRAHDVVLRVMAPWSAEYRLHRVVLLQAGFFEMLFEGGYREALDGERKVVELRFNDPNIIRAAFELCLAHLYRPTPLPSPPPSYIPAPSHPLTPAFPTPPSPPSPTPRLLLSLLATSSYLNIPTLVTDSTRLLLSTVSPWTVSLYLRFAIGYGLGEPVPGSDDTDEGVHGLGHELSLSSRPDTPETIHTVTADEDEYDLLSQKSTAPSTPPSAHPSPSQGPQLTSYGPPTNLLGQTCIAWLCRWGADLLPYEEAQAALPPPIMPSMSAKRVLAVWGKGGIPAAWAKAVLGSDELWVRDEEARWEVCRRVVDLRREGWRREEGSKRGGEGEREEERVWEALFAEGVYYSQIPFDSLTRISHAFSPHTKKRYTRLRILHDAHWRASLLRTAILSSTAHSPQEGMKVGEMGFIRSTAEIVQSGAAGSREADEEEGEQEEAYYAVTTDDAQRVGDWNPSSALAPLLLPPSSSAPAPAKLKPGYDERSFFGIPPRRRTPTQIREGLQGKVGQGGWTRYEPVRFGVEFFGVGGMKGEKPKVAKVFSRTVFYAGSLFLVYIQVVRKKGAEKDATPTGGAAGTEKDTTQLGVYLQRWSMVNPVPPASLPSSSTPSSNRPATSHRRDDSTASLPPLVLSPTHHSSSSSSAAIPVPLARSMTPSVVNPQHPQAGSGLPTPNTVSASMPSFLSRSVSPPLPPTTPVGPHPHPAPTSPTSLDFPSLSSQPNAHSPPPTPYRDPRQSLRAYFSVTCYSALGQVLTRFESAPDKFDVGQSWGWKSSCLREGAGEGPAGEGEGEGGLRVGVVIGLV